MTSGTPTYATAVPVEYPQEGRKKEDQDPGPSISNFLSSSQIPISGYQVEQLMQQGFTQSLAESMTRNKQAFPYRIWVIDNSGSMQTADGHRIIETVHTNQVKIVPGTRWEEIRECVNYHIRAATLLKAPSSFRLLNNPGSRVKLDNSGSPSGNQIFNVHGSGEDEHNAMTILRNTRPGGGTPLTAHIHAIYDQIRFMAPQLYQAGSRVVVVIATDGLPTDESATGGEYQQQLFVQALRSLEGLPVWLVIRLCTDDDDVVKFYNQLDEQLELSMDVLDDFCGEALEVYKHNKWLNYALSLHRCREMGYYDRSLDLIDERPLIKSELRDFFQLLLGDMDGIPDPSIDWVGFANGVEELLKRQSLQWNPVTKKMAPWVDLKALHRQYAPGGGCSCAIL